MFVSSFYCYLNYDPKKDFVMEFDSVWKWLGFSRKEECKRVLTKHFVENIDYRIEKTIPKKLADEAAPQIGGAGLPRNLGGAGLNKETILLTVNTFKKLCLKSNTKKE